MSFSLIASAQGYKGMISKEVSTSLNLYLTLHPCSVRMPEKNCTYIHNYKKERKARGNTNLKIFHMPALSSET